MLLMFAFSTTNISFFLSNVSLIACEWVRTLRLLLLAGTRIFIRKKLLC